MNETVIVAALIGVIFVLSIVLLCTRVYTILVEKKKSKEIEEKCEEIDEACANMLKLIEEYDKKRIDSNDCPFFLTDEEIEEIVKECKELD